ncbi:hypothetical protein ACFV0T_24475 [Streptomyces sp. NPDC059582]|uniref:hypothetical protein n=1 Tax=Streptomyces sp. NPDC059582 TaxID=3346875 RepID=UPI0036ADCFAB
MITVQPVLEICAPEGFDLWPVVEFEPCAFLALGGSLAPDEVGTAVMALAACNDIDPGDERPPRPADPVGGFLHGLLTMDPLFASGGLKVTDAVTGRVLLPGCCSGLEDRGDWLEVVNSDGRAAWFGHDPSPGAGRHGDIVRLTCDGDVDTSPVIEVPVTELRHLLAGVERDLADFFRLAVLWAGTHLPDRCEQVSGAISRALALSAR